MIVPMRLLLPWLAWRRHRRPAPISRTPHPRWQPERRPSSPSCVRFAGACPSLVMSAGSAAGWSRKRKHRDAWARTGRRALAPYLSSADGAECCAARQAARGGPVCGPGSVQPPRRSGRPGRGRCQLEISFTTVPTRGERADRAGGLGQLREGDVDDDVGAVDQPALRSRVGDADALDVLQDDALTLAGCGRARVSRVSRRPGRRRRRDFGFPLCTKTELGGEVACRSNRRLHAQLHVALPWLLPSKAARSESLTWAGLIGGQSVR